MPEVDTTIVSFVALVVATASMLISYRLYRLQHDPEVVVFATPDQKRQSVILLIVENTGGSVAHDVSFSFSSPLPGKAFGFEDAPEPKPMDGGPLITGIPSFGPGARRVITWGQYGGLHKGIGDSFIDITATYYRRRLPRLLRRQFKTVSRIDIRSFEGTDISDHNWDKKTAEAIGKIADAIAPLTSPAGRLLTISIREREPADRD